MSAAALSALVRFVSTTSLRDVPDEIVNDARRSLTDTVACMLGGSTAEPVRQLSEHLHDAAGRAPIIGSTRRATPQDAALVGGIAGTWMDADSGGTKHPAGGRVPPVPTAHPPVHIVPALLACVADSRPMDGAELLRIYLLSYELGARIGTASRLLPGVHPHGVHGTSAAAVACGLARGLSADALARAIELATALPLVTSLHVAMIGATVRNAYAGLGARNGMLAVDATVAGIRAPEDVVENMLSSEVSDALDEARLVDGLGTHWEAARGYIKLHACARWIHPALDAAAGLLSDDGMDPEQVEAIEVRTFRFAAMLNNPRPATDLAGKFSLPYAVAALVAYGRVELEAFSASALRRHDILDLAGRVVVVEDAAYTAALPARRPTAVTIRFRGGRSLSAAVDGSRGDPETAFTIDELEGKFLRLAGAALDSDRAESALAHLRRLPELGDARDLLQILCG